MNRIGVALGLGLALAVSRAHAVEVDYGDWKLDLSANLREIVTVTRDVDVGDLPLDPNAPVPLRSMLLATTRARLQLEARYGDHWTGQIVYDNELFLGTGRDSLAFRLAEQLGAPTWLDLDHTIADSRDATWRHLLYRGWLRYQADALEVTVGRQRIALGRTQLWNPTDLFNPIPPLAVEGDQRIGVDAALARVRVRDDLWAAAIFAPGVNDQNPSSAFRLELSRRELDGALMFALIDRDRVAGLDFSSNVRDAALRGEFTETWHFGSVRSRRAFLQPERRAARFLQRRAARGRRAAALGGALPVADPDPHGVAKPDGRGAGLRPDAVVARELPVDPRLERAERGVRALAQLVAAE